LPAEPYQLDVNHLKLFIFDLDGVITDTASVHAEAWKRTFDDFLDSSDNYFEPFEIKRDYPRHVDGKPRSNGIIDFLASRDIELPWGEADDSPDQETIHGLGNRKDSFFRKHVKTEGVRVYDTTLAFIHQLQALGLKVALVSSSKNTTLVLESTGLSNLFTVVVDGLLAERLGLPGKPAPDTFLEAARRSSVLAEHSAIVEDAVAGVEAGVAGGFTLVIGVARKEDKADLQQSGANVVVSDLGELVLGE
jgi:trehalose 6-phosphate phosphatase